ncbi:hypothetical protein [Paraglaciecola arctica]|uniref:hypothetical protein n=1 Tax=Paraglaciecola arctica TaxID=1128911 RepID=UPI002091A03E|nr:hypothetical protein [Paraglaciecola arctica]
MSNNKLQHFDNTEETPQTKSNQFFSKKFWLRSPKQIIPTLRSRFSQLTLSQWMYFFAFLMLMIHADEDIQKDTGLLWVGTIAGIGLVRELWHVFIRTWEHMLGKGLVLVLYAATANFAFAISALKINIITGIEPGPFVFTLGFATLIMLPFWLLMSSIMFFSVALVAGNLWLIVGVLLRLVKIKVRVHWEDRVFVIVTMILRLVLIPYVIMSIFYIAVPYAEQIELFDQPMALIKEESSEDANSLDETGHKIDDKIVLSESESKNIKLTLNRNQFILPVDESGKIKWLDNVIAGFIYHFETYPKSACVKRPEQRSLPIDENLILLVTKDDSVLGYAFSVGPCVGNYFDAKQSPSSE